MDKRLSVSLVLLVVKERTNGSYSGREKLMTNKELGLGLVTKVIKSLT